MKLLSNVKSHFMNGIQNNTSLDKKMFYEHLKPTAKDKYSPIFFDMPINPDNLRYRLIFDWSSIKPSGEFNPMMSAQLVDTFKTVGHGKYIVPDLLFNCIEEGVTTDYKLYKYLNAWIEKAFEGREEE